MSKSREQYRSNDRWNASVSGRAGSLETCPVCGKQSYRSRKAAKAAARRLYPDRRRRVYRCDGESGEWHLTSQPAETTARWKDWLARPEGES